jgi:GrpB-like predicted nucleotidyltransferase (UPF0157 family)
MTNRIEIFPYNPNWRLEFERIAAELAGALGPLAKRIDHIGSTSVPGLAAKDIIDVQVSVSHLEPELMKRLAAIGFSWRSSVTSDHRPPYDASSPDSEWEKWLFCEPEGGRPINLHVRILGRANQRYPLLFRDYLRTHPAMAASYAELKRRLALVYGEDRRVYVELKDPACDMIMAAAMDWAVQVGWEP